MNISLIKLKYKLKMYYNLLLYNSILLPCSDVNSLTNLVYLLPAVQHTGTYISMTSQIKIINKK